MTGIRDAGPASPGERSSAEALHAVVFRPHLGSPALDRFRDRYDPFAGIIAEHVTLVFPVPVKLPTMEAHVRAVARDVQPFEVRISGIGRSWDHWMFLEVREGADEVVALHDCLYTGPLGEHLRTDLPYVPHVGIGFFGMGPYDPLDPTPVELDRGAYASALEEATAIAVDARSRVDSIEILALGKDLTWIDTVNEVPVGRVS